MPYTPKSLAARKQGSKRKRKPKDRRLSACKRGYDRRWQRFREGYLYRNPVCVDCGVKLSTEIHHVKPLRDNPKLRLDESNLQALCKACHSKIVD